MTNGQKKSKLNKNKTGFTLVETLVAITILVVGVLGPLNVATRGITDGFYAKNQITAIYLAQEGLDLVNNKLHLTDDANLADWLDGLGTCLNYSDTSPPYTDVCTTAPNADSVFSDCSVGNCKIRYSNFSRLYEKYVPSNLDQVGPIIDREIKLIVTNNSIPELDQKEARVEVTVSWNDKTVPRSLLLSEYVYDI